MAIQEMHTFSRGDVWPSWITNSVQKALSTLAENFQLTRQDATHVQVTAGTDELAAIVSIDGRWRWVEATVSRAHPGGAAGTYDIYVVAADNKIDSTPQPGTDNTNYAFELRVLKSGETPTIVKGTLDVFRKVGTCEWSGTEITRVDQTVPAAPTHAHRHATGQPDAIAPADIGAAPESEAEALRAAGSDALQAGVVKAADWSFAGAINAATGALSSAAGTGGSAWVEVGGALIRTVTPSAVFGPIAAPALPASGKFMSIGVQLKPAGSFGNAATVSLVAGAEKSTEAEALAAPAGSVAGAVRVRDLIVKNTAGVYSVVAERDRRPWARGYFATQQLAAGTGASIAYAAINAALSQRVECSGGLVRARLAGTVSNAAKEVTLFRIVSDGAEVARSEQRVAMGTEPVLSAALVEVTFTPAAGSHLVVPQYSSASGATAHFENLAFTVEEVLRPSANNGTS